MNNPSPLCDSCGATLDAATPGGLCPRCLMAGAMQPTQPSAGMDRPEPPGIEAVRHAFPQLDILEFIGQGGMGWVFKARQTKLNRLVALKLLPASLAERDAAFAGRFDREGQLLARLHHPNIVAVHDSGAAGDFFYLLMEYVEGVNLRQAMRSSRFTPAQALAIVPHICDALQFAHEEGVLHRDIKPENILLDAKGRVKLVDFGIAKLIGTAADADGIPAPDDPGPNLTQSGATLGTPSYMAPEQRDTPANVDHRADIYSLGVVFYELLTGELPTGSFAPPSSKSNTDPRVDAIVQQALQKERTRRQSSAGEMKTQVETVAAGPAPSKPADHQLFHLQGFARFQSLAALRIAQVACGGFLGFLGYIPGWNGMFGFFGLFGLFGIAYVIEVFARRKTIGLTGIVLGGIALIVGIFVVFVLAVAWLLYREPQLRQSERPVPPSLFEMTDGTFGPVIERDITLGNDPHSFYSLDRGDYVPGPTDFTPPDGSASGGDDAAVPNMYRWVTDNDVDFLAMRNNGSPGLVLSDMVSSSCDEAAFDHSSSHGVSGDGAFRSALQAQFRPNFNRPLTGNNGGRITLLFQTRYDRIGMVQVIGVTSNPPGIRIRYKMIQPSESTPAPPATPSPAPAPSVSTFGPSNAAPAPPGTGAQSKRMRFDPFDPKEGLADRTNWEFDDKPSIWNPHGWAIVARMTIGGVVRAGLPPESQDFCRITLVGGDDDAVTLKVEDLKWNNTMFLNLPRDRPADLTINRIAYTISYSSIYVANDQPDTAPFAFIVVTGSDATTPAPSTIPDYADSVLATAYAHRLTDALTASMDTQRDIDEASQIYKPDHPYMVQRRTTLANLQQMADALRANIRQISPTGDAAIADAEAKANSQELVKIVDELGDTQQSIADASQKYAKDHPVMIDLNTKLQALQRQLASLRAAMPTKAPPANQPPKPSPAQ